MSAISRAERGMNTPPIGGVLLKIGAVVVWLEEQLTRKDEAQTSLRRAERPFRRFRRPVCVCVLFNGGWESSGCARFSRPSKPAKAFIAVWLGLVGVGNRNLAHWAKMPLDGLAG